jgi:hypothetical protein
MKTSHLFLFLLILTLQTIPAIAQDHENVEQVGRIYNHWSSSDGIVIRDNYAYIATGLSGLQIMDISNPDNLVIVGYYDDNPNSISDVYVSGDYAYLTDPGNYGLEVETLGGLLIVDISDPRNPVGVGACEAGEDYSSINVIADGDYAYLGETDRMMIGPGQLRIVDISDPENPEEVSNFNTAGTIWDICVVGDYAYAAMSGDHQGSHGLLVFDVSDPTNPERVGYYLPDWNGAESISVVGDYAYMSFDDGLHIIDISDPTNPEDVGRLEGDWREEDLCAQDNHVYEAGYHWGELYGFLRTVDVSDPTNPQQVSICRFDGYRPDNIFIAENTAFIVGYDFVDYHNYYEDKRQILNMINISDPNEPEVINVYQSGGYINDLFIAGEHAFVASGADGLRVVDISDSTEPVEVAVYEDAGNANAISVSNGYAFVGESSDVENGGNFRLIDINDPTNPEQIGVCHLDHFVDDIYISGDYAYLTCYGIDPDWGIDGGSLRVIDISDPTNPEEIGVYYDDCSCYDVFVSGNYAFVSMRYVVDHREHYGLRIIDISDPTNLEEVGLFRPLDMVEAVFVSGDYAYLTISDNHPGEGTITYYLSVIDISDLNNPEEVSSLEIPDKGNDLFVSGNYAYIANGWGGVRVINVSDPENLEEVGFYDTPGSANKIMVSGGLIYVADHTNLGIYRYRMEEPTITVSPEVVDFGEVVECESKELSITIGNWGNQDLVISDAHIEGDCFIVVFEDEFTLEADVCHELTVTFSPDTTRELEGTLIITSNDPYNDVLLIDIKGVGVEPGGVKDDLSELAPNDFYLYPAYPNPFNSTTTIHFDLPVSSDVSINLIDINGRQVATLVDDHLTVGSHSVTWNAKDYPAGLYLCRMEAGTYLETRKLLLIK